MEYYLNINELSPLYIIFHGLCHFKKPDREVLFWFEIGRMANDKYVAAAPTLNDISITLVFSEHVGPHVLDQQARLYNNSDSYYLV